MGEKGKKLEYFVMQKKKKISLVYEVSFMSVAQICKMHSSLILSVKGLFKSFIPSMRNRQDLKKTILPNLKFPFIPMHMSSLHGFHPPQVILHHGN